MYTSISVVRPFHPDLKIYNKEATACAILLGVIVVVLIVRMFVK